MSKLLVNTSTTTAVTALISARVKVINTLQPYYKLFATAGVQGMPAPIYLFAHFSPIQHTTDEDLYYGGTRKLRQKFIERRPRSVIMINYCWQFNRNLWDDAHTVGQLTTTNVDAR